MDTFAADGTTRRTPHIKLANVALAFAIVAVIGSVIASAILGASLGPQQATSGGHFLSMPAAYRSLATGLGLSQVIWTLVGIAALTLAIVAARNSGKQRAIIAIVVSVLAPVVSIAVFTGLVLATSPLG